MFFPHTHITQHNCNTMKQQQATGSILKRLVLSASFIAATVAPVTSYAAANGIIQGRITDKADGEGVVGASVVVAGTTLGTSTDINGNFVLRNVPANAQKVNVSIIGYAPTAQTVTVGDGQTVTINFALGQTTVMASEVVVGASLYKQDRMEVPVTVNVVSKEKIKQEPNASLDKVVQDVPGVVVSRAGGVATSTLQIRGSNTYQGGGIGTRVNAFYDGFPINTPDSGEIVWQTVNMNAADKVEVLKGAAATLYGSGAMGGVVNVTGHAPDKMEVRAGSSIGFYDGTPDSDQSLYRKDFTPVFWNTYVGFGNKTGKWTYDVLYSHSDDDGYRQNAWSYMNDVKFKARYNIDSKQYLQLSSSYNSTVGGYAYQWPYSNTLTGFPPTNTQAPIPNRSYDIYTTFDDSALPTDFYNAFYGITAGALRKYYADHGTFYYTPATYNTPENYSATVTNATGEVIISSANDPDIATVADAAGDAAALRANIYDDLYDVYRDDLIDRKSSLVGLNYVNMLSDNLSLDTRVYYTYNSSRIEYNRTSANQSYPTGGSADPAYPSVKVPGQFNQTDDNRFGAGIKLDWRLNDAHRLLFGLDGNIVETRTTQVAAEYPVTNQFNDIQEKNAAAFLQDEWKITDRLTALGSARYDWSGIDADYVWNSANVATKLNNTSVDAVSPRVAFNYKAADDMALRASWGKSFRAPTLYERFVRMGGIFYGTPNPNLDKETLTAWEVGVFKQFGDKVSVDVAGFINDYDDLIQSIITGSTFQYRNITKARIWGIEAGVNYRPTSDWNLNMAYTYLNAKNSSYVLGQDTTLDKNPDPEWLPYRPEHTASASATWKANKKLSLNVNGRYVGKYNAVSVYTNPLGTNYPGDFIVMNAGAKYQFTKNVSGSLNCNNIGNVQYEEAEWFRAPGRSFVAGIDLSY